VRRCDLPPSGSIRAQSCPRYSAGPVGAICSGGMSQMVMTSRRPPWPLSPVWPAWESRWSAHCWICLSTCPSFAFSDGLLTTAN